MKNIKLILLIIATITIGYLWFIKSNKEIIVVNKDVCMKTTKNNVIYECLYKKKIFSPTEYAHFLDKNKDISFFQRDRNVDFLLEYIFIDNYCTKNYLCKLENSKEMYDKLFQCAKNNKYCLNFIIMHQFRKNICSNNKIDESLFLNKTIQKKYLNLSIKDKLILCNFNQKINEGHYMIGLKSYTYEDNE